MHLHYSPPSTRKRWSSITFRKTTEEYDKEETAQTLLRYQLFGQTTDRLPILHRTLVQIRINGVASSRVVHGS